MSTIQFTEQEGIVRIVLNRPQVGNAINLVSAEAFSRSISLCTKPTVRAVLISGKGSNFCTGGDLRSFSEQSDKSDHVRKITKIFHEAISIMARMDAPVVAAVQGAAAGGGMSLAMACDLVVAAETATFNPAYLKAGLCPDGSFTYFVPRLTGLKRTLQLLLTNRILSASEALQWGLVSVVVSEDNLLSTAEQMISELALGPTHAFGETKRLLQQTFSQTLESQMELESLAISELMGSNDGSEGIASFLEKRKPKFKGN